MTPAAKPDARGQRVSTEEIASLINAAEGYERAGNEAFWIRAILDLRDRNADVARLEAENASLRAANATAKRDGWIAGRDAAAQVAADTGVLWSSLEGQLAARSVAFHARALTPPATEGERDA